MKKLVMFILLTTGCGFQETGPQGPPGNGCSVTNVSISSPAPNGGTLISCTDGTSSLILNGNNGSPGTLITPVQLCPGTSVYPSVFIEYAFCINNNLWGVYSEKDGFLTEFLPGNWTSNTIGSRCNFTVNNNCVITH